MRKKLQDLDESREQKLNIKIKSLNKTDAMLVNGLTLEQWIKQEIKPRYARLWGDKVLIKPVCSKDILGDGQQLIYLMSIDQRPQRWYFRIDSKTDIFHEDFNLEEILQLLENEFGKIDYHASSVSEFKLLKNQNFIEYDTYKDYKKSTKYPAVAWTGGHWGLVVNMVSEQKTL